MGIVEFFRTIRILFGEYKQAEIDVSMRPKSVSAMTRVFEPQITRDFKDFVWEEFRDKAQNMLKMSLLAIASGNLEKISENVADDVKAMIINKIQEDENQGYRTHYDNIIIHRTEISNYKKVAGKCIITIQSAVEYTYYVTDSSGKVVKGRNDLKKQTKYNMELMYIQDAEIANRAGDGNVLGNACPFCGAPLVALGDMMHEYCGAKFTPINIKVCSLHNLYEVDYNHV